MRIIETKVYTFDELSDRAKEKARDWYRETSAGDNFWAEPVTEDFVEVLKACGFDIATIQGRRSEPAIYWELNPDNAGFDASWRASDVNVDPIIADRPLSYRDTEGKEQRCEGNARLVSILERIKKLAHDRRNAYGSVSTSRRSVNIGETEWTDESCDNLECDCAARADEFREIVTDLAHYFAVALSATYEYENSDEAIDETILANEYEFTEDGERA